MAALVEVRVHPPAGTLVLNRPERRNALSRNLLAELRQGFHDLHQEARVRAVILTGAGTAFCAGMDLGEMQATHESENAFEQWQADAQDYLDVLLAMLYFPKPIIAAVNGPAVAGGAGLVLANDLVLAAHAARSGLPEPRRGIVAGMVAPLLAFRAGAGAAAELLLTGRLIEAAEAHRRGLYHELIDAENTWVRASALAAECALNAPSSLQLTKRLLNETIGETLFTELSAGAAASAAARTTEAAREGLAAFLEKREPKW